MTLWHYLILYNVQQQKHKSDIPDLLSTREREGDMATAHRDGLSDSPEHYYENVDRNNIQGSIIFSNPDLASTIGKRIPSSLNVSPLCRSTKSVKDTTQIFSANGNGQFDSRNNCWTYHRRRPKL